MSIESHTRDIFAIGGPLHQVIMQRIDPGAEHRPEQQEAAIDYAAQLDQSFGQLKIRPLVRQIAPGVGKTLSYLVPVMLALLFHERRTVISTFTTELRNSIKEKDAQIAMAAISLHLGKPIDINVVIRESGSSFASISVAARHLKDTQKVGTVAQQKAAQAYFDWCVGELLAGELPRLNDLIANGNILPCDADFSLTFEEQRGKLLDTISEVLVQPFIDDYCLRKGLPAINATTITEIAALKFKATNSRDGEVGAADIILVTHAMFLMNNVHFGEVLHTTKENNKGTFNIVLDEAEMLANQASEWTKFKITKAEIEEAFDMLLPFAPAEVARGQAEVAILESSIISDYHHVPRRASIAKPTNTPRRIEILEDDEPRNAVGDRLVLVHEAIHDAYQLCSVKLNLGEFQHVESVLATIHGITEVIDHATGSSSQSSVIKGTKTKPVTEIEYDNHGTVVGFTVQTLPLHNNYLASWAWRNAVQAVDHVYALSATLVGGNVMGKPDPYEIFMKRIGIDKGTAKSLPAISARNHGGLSRIVLTSATIPRDKDMSIYAQHIVKCLILADKTPFKGTLPTRALVLFHSKILLDETLALLRTTDPSIAIRVHQGKVSLKLQGFINDPRGIWFGHNWQGTNFVDSTGVTLLGRVLIARAPVTPPSPVKERYNPKQHMSDNMDDAAMKIIQGAGRGMRRPTDKPELWLLDPHIFHQRVQRVCGGKGGRALEWNAMLDGLPVHWTRTTWQAINDQYTLRLV